MFGPKLPAPLAAAGLAAVVFAGGVATAAPALAAAGSPSAPARTSIGGAAVRAADPGAAADPATGAPGAAADSADPTDPTDLTDPADAGADPVSDPAADAPTDAPSAAGADTVSGQVSGQAADPGSDAASDAGSAQPSGPSSGDGGVSAFGSHAINVSPASVAPGGMVTIRLVASCTAGHKAKASAAVFVDSITLAPASDGNGLEGSAFIKSDATSGSYTVSVSCDGGTSTAQASVTVTTTATPVTPLKPVRPVPAGGGGTAQLAAGPAVAGSNAVPLAVTGAFAAVGLAGLAVRRRRTSGPRG